MRGNDSAHPTGNDFGVSASSDQWKYVFFYANVPPNAPPGQQFKVTVPKEMPNAGMKVSFRIPPEGACGGRIKVPVPVRNFFNNSEPCASQHVNECPGSESITFSSQEFITQSHDSMAEPVPAGECAFWTTIVW